MTYIDRLNAFNRWLESNALPGNAQLMYFKLLNVFNRAGWPESVQIDTLRLVQLTGCQKDTAYRARDRLAEAGFISYKKGSKGRPTAYFLSGKPTGNPTVSATENPTVNPAVSASHIKTDTKTKKKKKTNFPPNPPGGTSSYDIKELEGLSRLRLPDNL